jgi:hypothetical protein
MPNMELEPIPSLQWPSLCGCTWVEDCSIHRPFTTRRDQINDCGVQFIYAECYLADAA